MEVDGVFENTVDEQLSTCMDTSLTIEVKEKKWWCCEVCNRQIAADELENHFMYHPIFMYPSTRDNETLKVVDDYEDRYNEIAGLLGKILWKFRSTAMKDDDRPKEHKKIHHHHHQKEKKLDNNVDPYSHSNGKDDRKLHELLVSSKDCELDNRGGAEQKSHNHQHHPQKQKKLDTNLSPASQKSKDKRKVGNDNELGRSGEVMVPPKKQKLHQKSTLSVISTASTSSTETVKIKKKVPAVPVPSTSPTSSTETLKVKKPLKKPTTSSPSSSKEIKIKKPKVPTFTTSPSSSKEIKIKKPKEPTFVSSPSSSKEVKKSKEHVHVKKDIPDSEKEKVKSDDDKNHFVMNMNNPYKSKRIQETVEVMIRKMKKIKMKVRDQETLDTLDEAMKATFDYRKHEIQFVQISIYKALFIFPAMTDYRILKKEFERLRNVDLKELDRKLRSDLTVEHQRYRTKYYISPVACIGEVIEALRKQDDEDLRRDLEMLCFGYQKTQAKFCKKLFKHRKTEQEEPFKGITPTIDILGDLSSDSKKITVYCEQRKICRCPNFYEAVMCAYAMYWIFNLCYEKGAEKLFERFDQLIGE